MKRFVLTILLLLCWTTLSQAQANMVSIAGELVNMRSGPGENYEVLWELGKGYPLLVIDQQDNWLQVSDYEDDVGWVRQDQVSDKRYMVVKMRMINIRSGPGEDSPIVRQAEKGVVFRTLGRQDDWIKVKHEEENVTGWVLRGLLWGW